MTSLSDVKLKGRLFVNINVWFSMMSGHGPNSISFNFLIKKEKAWTSRTLLHPQPPTYDNISFLPYLPPPPTSLPHPPQSGHYICITPHISYSFNESENYITDIFVYNMTI